MDIGESYADDGFILPQPNPPFSPQGSIRGSERAIAFADLLDERRLGVQFRPRLAGRVALAQSPGGERHPRRAQSCVLLFRHDDRLLRGAMADAPSGTGR